MRIRVLIVVLFVFFILAGYTKKTSAEIPGNINFQGYLTDGTHPVPDADYNMIFSLYTVPENGTSFWSEVHTVSVERGIYNVILGNGSIPLTPELFDGDIYLGVTVEGDDEMKPRQKLTSTPFSFKSSVAETAMNSDTLDWQDSSAFDQSAHVNDTNNPHNITAVGIGALTVESDPTVPTDLKDGVNWSEIADRPSGLDDGDDIGITGVNWNEIAGIPAGFADGIDNVSSAGTSDGHSLDAADGLPEDALYIDNEGNVGIGNTLPAAPLSIGTPTAGGNIYVGAIDSNKEGAEIAWEGSGDYTNWVSDVFQNDFRLWNFSLTPNLLRIYNFNPFAPTGLYVQGNTSFGTATQIGTLTLSSGITDDAGSYANGLVFANHSFMPELGPWAHAAIWSDGKTGYSGELVFGTDGDGGRNINMIQERMRITKDGFVGIGTSTPEYVLDVHGVIKGRGLIDSEIMYARNSQSSTEGRLGDFQFGVYGSNDGAGINTYAGFFDGPVKIQGTNTVEVLEITGGADLSERFDIKKERERIMAKAGMVVCIDPENPGELEISKESYDKKVAGIISGAGGVNPGMLMGQKGTNLDGTIPVALTGRVYAMVDAKYGPILPGDLLTTSNTPGHAMKVTDYTKAQGAIIGKAMSSLEKNTGLVLVLVTLQ